MSALLCNLICQLCDPTKTGPRPILGPDPEFEGGCVRIVLLPSSGTKLLTNAA